MQTSCPNCQAKFIITQESLVIADGMVRCGQCDHVFDAEQNIVSQGSSGRESLSNVRVTDNLSTGSTSMQSDRSSNEEHNNDGLEITDYQNDGLDEMSGLINDDLMTHEVDPMDKDIFNGLMDEKIEDAPASESDSNLTLDDELLDSVLNDSFVDDLNDTHPDFSLDEQLSESAIETSDSSEDDISRIQKNISHAINKSPENTEDFDDLDSDDLLTQLAQLEADYKSSSSHDEQAFDKDSAADNTAEDATSSAHKFPQIEETIVMEDTSLPERKMPAERPDDSAYFNQSSFSKQSPVALFSWLAATVLLILLLGVQYLHFNSSRLAQNDTYRPFLEILCPISKCELPFFKSTRKIVTIDHDVYSHKIFKNALEVQLTFKNKAAIKQAFPVLEITFYNPLGAVIAQRKFQPDEYIENKTQLSQGMNPNQTQKVKLDIIDPDPTALLSFQFNYL